MIDYQVRLLQLKERVMPKRLSDDAVQQFHRDGFCPPIQVLSSAEVDDYRACLERVEANHPRDRKKLKTNSHILCPWVLDLAEHPTILDVFEDLIGPNILCWSMAWRIKEADGTTFAGWHQDAAYNHVEPDIVIGALALSECGFEQGCLSIIPGSQHTILAHEETEDAASILARGQYISDAFDTSSAVDLALKPGEIGLFNHSVIHGSRPNVSDQRRLMLLVEMMPTHTVMQHGLREAAMLVRGVDEHHHFEDVPRPDAEFSPTAVANWQRIVQIRAKRMHHGSNLAPSEAYGGTRPAT